LSDLRNAPGNEAAQRSAQLVADIKCAIEIGEALLDFKVAVQDTANRAVLVLGNLTSAIDKATTQAEISSQEATSVAKESAKFSQQLNRLTLWVITAAVLSAIAAIIQAGVALYGIRR
jgi:hypothetical protein